LNRELKVMEPLIHEASMEMEWNESYYFVFYDKKTELGGMTRLGFKPNKQEGTGFFILFLPNGSAALFQSAEETTNKERKDMRVGSLAHQRLSDGNWNYIFKGSMIVAKNPEDLPRTSQQPELVEKISNVKMDFSFSPINEVYEYSENMTVESRELGRKSGDAHWEQIGKIEGTIRFDNNTFRIHDTIGQRDHTHGVRDWTGIGNWLYYVVWFSENLCINPAAIVAEDGRISSGGFIFQKGRNIPIKTVRVINQEFRNNTLPTSSKIEITDALDRKHVLEGKAMQTVPIPFTDSQGKLSILAQGFGDFKLDGQSGGYGSYETLRRIK
jgi:hypothetical protein